MNFASATKDFNLKFIEGAEDTIRGTTIKLWSAIIEESPVNEGRFKGSWFATGLKPSTKLSGKKDKSGIETKAAAANKVNQQKDVSTFTLTNNLPYAQTIEFGGYPKPVKRGTYLGKGKGYEINSSGGFSKQAPGGVVRVNVKRFNRLLEAEAKKKLKI
tara:strand:+ start:242 stop:718 length:477 start_codon:yes stop_codon:yes gene_type:complete